MALTYTLLYLQTRSLSELYVLRGALQKALAACPQGSIESAEILQSLDHVRWLLALRAPGFRPR
ncbi:hypothetical protein JOH52_000840 [Sinorhizobium meliloti]|uniref:hypothetical protein n=1 Tax=Rhizobium meliloti TaxID=382 RepID=UPI000D121C98|nr:hypothetical protein [Sinorhizobium meliloti]MBP2464819.1 hypothetical protein [Sinorhizobium meliloti]MQW83438.1 hypothetical protein [Sinorhizobium meliloti]PST29496.1 hypothetical protein C7U62_02585 [Mesorhizobium loti]GEC36456.1 hypothetical protein EME01_05280 [Sinorhizobium meliloti]